MSVYNGLSFHTLNKQTTIQFCAEVKIDYHVLETTEWILIWNSRDAMPRQMICVLLFRSTYSGEDAICEQVVYIFNSVLIQKNR